VHDGENPWVKDSENPHYQLRFHACPVTFGHSNEASETYRLIIQILVRQVFDLHHFITRLCNRMNNLVEFQVNSSGVAILRVLNKKYDQKSDDGRGCKVF
jgi:hypothetical protein